MEGVGPPSPHKREKKRRKTRGEERKKSRRERGIELMKERDIT